MAKTQERSALLAGADWWGPAGPPATADADEPWPPPLAEVIATADAEARRHEPPLVQAVAAQACRSVLESPSVVDLTTAGPPAAAGRRPAAAHR